MTVVSIVAQPLIILFLVSVIMPSENGLSSLLVLQFIKASTYLTSLTDRTTTEDCN